MTPVFLQDMAWISALGRGSAARDALFAAQPGGVAPTDQSTPGRMLHLGRVAEALPALDAQPVAFRSRTNALLAALLPDLQASADTAIARFGPHRVAVVLGVSAAGLQE
ncbi:MAG: beta-ketoacyl-[acyl-carrier-protein] synthase II, partial [Comamonadaceae bacterium]